MIYPGIPIIIVAYVPIYGDDWGMVHYIVSHIYIYIYIYIPYTHCIIIIVIIIVVVLPTLYYQVSDKSSI